MTESPIRQVEIELDRMAQQYAAKIESMAVDPYFRDAVMKVAVSAFVWALYHAHSRDGRSLAVLRDELTEQCAAVTRCISPESEKAAVQ